MKVPALSVIIPTHRRPSILRHCLAYLERQSIAKKIEVIVVSDGPDPATAELFQRPATCNLQPVTYIAIPKSHQGIARNRGVAKAKAPITLFIGDDIFLDPDACEKHLAVHSSPTSSLVLGFTTWDPACGITPVMRWLEESGWQFGYPKIAEYAGTFVSPERQHWFTYTSHISLPTQLARAFPFREDVSLYGWEDVVWGKALATAGIPLLYQPEARALHHHHLTLADSLRRMHTLGVSAVRMEKLEPELKLVPRGVKLLKYRMASLLPTLHGRHAKAFLNGIQK